MKYRERASRGSAETELEKALAGTAESGQHTDAKQWAEIVRLRKLVAELTAANDELAMLVSDLQCELSETKAVDAEEYRYLLTIIKKALGEARASSIPLGMTEAAFYEMMLRRVESTLAEVRIIEGSNN